MNTVARRLKIATATTYGQSQCLRSHQRGHRHAGPRDQLQLRLERKPNLDHAELERPTVASVGGLQLGDAQHAGRLLRRRSDRSEAGHAVAGHYPGNTQRHVTSRLRLQQLAPGVFN